MPLEYALRAQPDLDLVMSVRANWEMLVDVKEDPPRYDGVRCEDFTKKRYRGWDASPRDHHRGPRLGFRAIPHDEYPIRGSERSWVGRRGGHGVHSAWRTRRSFNGTGEELVMTLLDESDASHTFILGGPRPQLPLHLKLELVLVFEC